VADIITPVALGGQAFPALSYSNTFSVAIGTASVQSNTFTGNAVTLIATSDCWCSLIQGTATPHTTGSFFLPRGVFFTVAVPTGSGRIAVIQDSAAGFLSYLVAAQG
jgi:hypothetical protein